MSQKLPERLLTTQEAAAQIGVSELAIRHATHGGRLPFVRKSGRNWIEIAQLQAYHARTQANWAMLNNQTR